ncbi:MAG TPA: DUF2169 domain-containing protein [Planctomycetota bacterium]|nr:DUF2169 domain-containing protein [Planctomycetota bacterium]
MDLLNETPLQPGWIILPLPGRTSGASFALKGTFSLKPDAPAAWAEAPDALDGDVPEAEGSPALRYTRDLTAPKPMVDLLIAGAAFAPGAKPTDMMPISAKIGAWTKMLAVLGDRRKTSGLLLSKVSAPVPFMKMPLTWSHALGGLDSRKNPAGRGLDDEADDKGETFIRVPNIVRVDEAGLDVRALKEPAGFGPINPEWESRAAIAKRAHYGARWLKERWPAPPEDFDPDYFNAAPADQRVPLGSIKGNEALEFLNLHSARQRYKSELPGIRARLFLEEEDPAKKDGPPLFREIPLRIDTVWVEPSADKLILVWRGFSPVRSKKLKEVTAVVIATEPLAQEPAPAEQYRTTLAGKREEREKKKTAPPPAPPTFEPLDIPAPEVQMEAIEKEIAEEYKKAEAELEQEVAEVDAKTRGAAAAELAKEGLPTGIVYATPPADPASVAAQAAKDFEAIAAVNPKAAKLLSQPPTAAALDVDAQIKAHFDEFEKEFAKPLFPPGSPDAPPGGGEEGAEEAEPPAWTRERVVAHAAEKKTFDQENLEGLDLSALDLSEAVFEDCVLTGCSLKGATLTKTAFRRCALTGANLTGARLADAELSFCDLTEADLSEAVLEKSILDDADCSGSKFERSTLTSVSAQRAAFVGVSFAGAKIRECVFREADFEGANLEKLSLGKSSFRSANAYGVKGSECDFEGCDLGNFRGGEGATFTGAIFRHCKAAGSVWEGAVLDRANFSSADLRRANFSAASLLEAKFGQAKLAKARFPEANLTRAEFQKADLFRATFEGALVDGADFRVSNAYEAEFLDTTGSNAKFDGSNLKGTKLA